MSVKLVCGICGAEYKEVAQCRKTKGHQYTEETVGYYHLYECSCGKRYWEFKEKH